MGSPLRFINPNAAPAKAPNALRNFIAIVVEVWGVLAAFGGVTLVCAVLFYIGTPRGWGIQPTFGTLPSKGLASVTFLECVHFSVVTIATLGYGDFRPESYGRLVADTEVVFGIVLMGAFVSRLVSRQQDRMTKRLVRGQLNAEIQDFRGQLGSLLKLWRGAPPVLVNAEKSSALYMARGLVTSIARYWRHEAEALEFNDVLPVRASGRLLGEMIELLDLVAVSTQGKVRSDLHNDDFKAIRSITESTLVAASALADRISDDGLNHSRDRATALVANLRSQLHLHNSHAPT